MKFLLTSALCRGRIPWCRGSLPSFVEHGEHCLAKRLKDKGGVYAPAGRGQGCANGRLVSC